MGWNGTIALPSLYFFPAAALVVMGTRMRVAIEQWHVLDLPTFIGRSWVEPGESSVWSLYAQSVLFPVDIGNKRTREKKNVEEEESCLSMSLGIREMA